MRMAGVSDEAAGWNSLLVATGCDKGFEAAGLPMTSEHVTRHLVADPENASSILSCIEAARQNGRAVRTALTVDMWVAINETWREARRLLPAALEPDALPGFLDWVRGRSLLFNGAYADTMLRTDSWRFVLLGTMLERADNTARLLDVKHALLDPKSQRQTQSQGTNDAVDYVQWQAVLRSVSALRAYNWVYHARLQPKLIADLLILRPEFPRSILACYRLVAETLDAIAEANQGARGECHAIAAELLAELNGATIETISERGLHNFLTHVIDRGIELGIAIDRFYMHG
jgi:uncharacterized alpha-E superfamily protein